MALAAIILVSDSGEGERSFLDDDTNYVLGGEQVFLEEFKKEKKLF